MDVDCVLCWKDAVLILACCVHHVQLKVLVAQCCQSGQDIDIDIVV